MRDLRYEVGPFRVDPSRRRLHNGDLPVALTPKVFELLLAFVERPGTVLSKDDLIQILWPDVAVEENNLTHCIAKLRRALGDDIHERRFIVTVPNEVPFCRRRTSDRRDDGAGPNGPRPAQRTASVPNCSCCRCDPRGSGRFSALAFRTRSQLCEAQSSRFDRRQRGLRRPRISRRSPGRTSMRFSGGVASWRTRFISAQLLMLEHAVGLRRRDASDVFQLRTR
jgi:hypothetical protein